MYSRILYNVKESVSKYAEVISQITEVNVEVIDCNFVRVAGTRDYSNNIGEKLDSRSFIYKKVFETARRHIIYDPTNDDICLLCHHRLTCNEKFEIVTPVFINGKVVGIVALIATTEEQKEKLLEGLTTYLSFIEQISDFISAKASENFEHESNSKHIDTLTKLMNNIKQGVLILGDNDIIKTMNVSAKEQLKLSDQTLGKSISYTPTGDSISGINEYRLTIEKITFSLFGTVHDIEDGDNDNRKIFIFTEEAQIRSELYNMINMVDTVGLKDIIGKSKQTEDLKENILKISNSYSTVLITGESGTGKEMVATSIWKASNRKKETFVPVNCAAIPEALLESELFGYVKGAFTGADPKGKIGKFEIAHNGVIFLDEIGDMPLYLQAKLLRVLQEKKITRVGSNNQIDINVRVLAATNKNLQVLIKEKKFREDLFYRLNVIPLYIQPLRERIEDIDELIYLFINKYSSLFSKYFTKIEKNVIEALKLYNWPGNVRELENSIEFMINMMNQDGILDLETLPNQILNYSVASEPSPNTEKSSLTTLKVLEETEIKKAIAIYGLSTSGKKLISKKLGIGIATLYRKLANMNI